MITPAYARTMARYNAEMNRRLYGAAERLGEAKRREEGGVFWKSIHGTLSHIYWGDCMWMSRLDGWEKPSVPIRESGRFVEDFDELAKRRAEADRRLLDWACRIDSEWLKGDVAWYSGAVERDLVQPRWATVTHLFNHQTHHRGQAHALITRAGERTGDTDLVFILDGFDSD